MTAVISLLAKAILVLGFLAGVVVFYGQSKFNDEWSEDHAKAFRLTTRWRLSATAIFSVSLSTRCRRRHRRLIVATIVFLALAAMEGFLQSIST